jgi:hypothetical protein
MKAKNLLLVVTFSFFFINLFSQSKAFKFGRVEQSDLTNMQCPIDSSAEAYVMGDYGSVKFEYIDYKDNFQSVFERHIRIKILKKTALHWADFIIGLHRSVSVGSEEKVDIKAYTYNFENGEVVESKLEKSAIFKEEVNKSRINQRFTMPNVKEGSVIEVSYKIYSEFWIIRDWDFQRSIPTMISQYYVEIPEYYNYKSFQNGYESLKITSTTKPSSFTYSWNEEDRNGMKIQNSRHSAKIDYTSNVTNYLGENIKAFKDEPLMSSKKNYESSIEFELQSVQFPHSLLKTYTTNWASITKQLMEYDDFGDIIKKEGATNDIVKEATNGLTLPLDKAKAIYAFIRNKFKWDEQNRLYTSKSIRKTIDTKAGNSADINLLLIASLKNAGLKADPVVLSTRDNGMIIMSYPVLQKLNYVIALVEIDGNQYLLDATDKFSPFGFLPEKCLNGQGRIIRELIPGDIELTSDQKYNRIVNVNLKLNENGELSGNWMEVRKGYAAHNFRSEIAEAKSSDDYIQEKQKEQGLTISKYEFENLDSLHKDVNIKYDIVLTGQVETTGNLMMIHPLLSEQMLKNRFTLEERKFPVDYSYLINKTFIAQYEIPEGYQVETLPKPISMALPDKNAQFTYNVGADGKKIQVMRKLAINKVVFLPADYLSLKEFYNQMVAKEAEVIVLKKI